MGWKRSFKRQSGAALVMILVFSGALLMLGAALLSYSFTETLIARYQEEDTKLYYLAEAGLEAGLAALRRDFSHQSQLSGSIGGGTFAVTFGTPSPGRRSITSTAILGRNRKTLSAVAELDGLGRIRATWVKAQ